MPRVSKVREAGPGMGVTARDMQAAYPLKRTRHMSHLFTPLSTATVLQVCSTLWNR